MAISDELDMLATDVGANLADRSVTLILRRRGFDSATMTDSVLGSVSMSVAAQVSAVRAAEGDGGALGGPGAGGEMCELIVTAAAIAAATKTTTGTLDARLTANKPDGGDLVVISGVEWSVVAAKLQVGGRLWRVVLARKKSG